eukprot:GDKK01072075.1.p1 GENE.GDKK01072075.1~~GDKK01072075.1.p1  ORF type:complete len:141 (-),score=8.90 GDKK01072075.1:76-456(-)
MFTTVRSAFFRTAGGFAITDFYLNALPLNDTPPQPTPSTNRWWWPFGRSPQPRLEDYVEQTFREDLTELVQDYQTAAMVGTGATLLMGGPWALAGSAMAVFSDTQEGLNIYLRVKDWYEGNSYDEE